jgi:hypothetical protein
MYGMVNKAIEDMVILGHGEETWEQIRQKAGVEEDAFVSTEGYPDEMTYALVDAASEVLRRPNGEILEAFGVHWVVKTAQEGYGDMMAAGGRTVGEFLVNLPNFHSRVSLIFPHLTPPQFLCTDVTERSVRMHYRSHRAGLAPFVEGLFKGLGQMFSTPVSVEHVVDKSAGADHDEFVVRW